VAAALATILAMFITSRPFDPGAASLAPQQTIPAGPVVSPSAKVSPTVSPTAQTKPAVQQSPSISEGEIAPALDDGSIQSRIDASLAADATLAKLDVSTLVENGKVTVFGSVRSTELKQRVEKVIRSIKGVATVNNQLVVNEATP
jgi:hyperosmotically inducible protein